MDSNHSRLKQICIIVNTYYTNMELIYRISTIIISMIIFSIIVIFWLWCRNPYHLIKWWNYRIKTECDLQDLNSINGIPSYHNVWDSSNKTAIELHRLIRLNHDDILYEVTNIMDRKNKNNIHDPWMKDEEKWNPIWIKIMGDWDIASDELPTLKRITSMFPEISMLHVSIFYPGNTLVEHRGLSRAVQRYHYGLKVSPGDVGLKIAGYDVKWKEKEGFIWDDTLSHSAWNHTSEPRIVIFADIARNLSPI